MSSEQREILEMVASGDVTAEEGARLLEAVERGREKRRRTTESPAGRARRHRQVMMENVTETLSSIGPAVRSAVAEAVTGVSGTVFVGDGDEEDELLEEVELTGEGIEPEKGTVLEVRNGAGGFRKGGDLLLERTEEPLLGRKGDAPEVRVLAGDGIVRLEWGGEDLALLVPDSVTEVRATLAGGRLRAVGLRGDMKVRSVGGGVRMEGVSGRQELRSVGGDVSITFSPGWVADSRVSTVGGAMSLCLPADSGARVSASSFGGSIDLDPSFSSETRSSGPGRARVEAELGGGEGPRLGLKAMGGNVSVHLTEGT